MWTPLLLPRSRCISSISLYNYSGDTTMRTPLVLPPSLCCHRRVSPPVTLLQPIVALIGQCLSLCNCSGDPPPPHEPLFFFHQRCAATELSRLQPRCSGHHRCTSFSRISISCTNIFLFSRNYRAAVPARWISNAFLFGFPFCKC